jgi:hypothetical protein
VQEAGPVLPLSRAVSLSNDWGAPHSRSSTNFNRTPQAGCKTSNPDARFSSQEDQQSVSASFVLIPQFIKFHLLVAV